MRTSSSDRCHCAAAAAALRPTAAVVGPALGRSLLAGRSETSHYWPRFPYRPLARFYNVFLPMAYATDRHVRGVNATRAYDTADVAIIRARSGKPHVPIHLIGGLANAMGVREVAGFMRAVADCAPLGYSLYAFSVTRQATWKALAAPPAADGRACA